MAHAAGNGTYTPANVSASFIDSSTQYCVADSTKTLHLDDIDLADDPADCLASLYTPASAEQSICHNTMSAEPSSLGDRVAACFEVSDLSKDPRFVAVPEKAGSSSMTYYCGTPLRTRNGVVIGALCIFDDKPRASMSAEELRFLGAVAKNVITHLELLRDQSERRRATRMNRCLNTFVDPASQVRHRRDAAVPPEHLGASARLDSLSSAVTTPSQGQSPRTGPARQTSAPSPAPSSARSGSSGSGRSEAPAAGGDYEAGRETRVRDSDHKSLYVYGAELLQDALDLDGGGGVVFLDASARICPAGPLSPGKFLGLSTITQQDAYHSQLDGHGKRRAGCPDGMGANLDATSAEVVASTVSCSTAYAVPSPDFLTLVREQHPRGRLWIFDSEGNICDGGAERDGDVPSPADCDAARQEAQLLRRYFPEARQIIGIPIFDSHTSHWTFCFAWSTLPWRTFSYSTDFLFMVAFCNCLATEKSRLATVAADQQKGDFIGSISHELRSPLHGVLGSCEFLQETAMSTFQTSLVDTIDSCARTLLDTISMVLDYSKINAFDRRQRSLAPPSSENAISEPQSALSIYEDVDLALVTEQVVEGVQSGHVFRDATTLQFSGQEASDAPQWKQQRADVQITLDITPGDWCYVTQPGAYRRIVMNIVGNALKYTAKGSIQIRLDKLSSAEGAPSLADTSGLAQVPHDTDMVRLTVTDTGKGISPEYLRTKLFEPFSQEDTLAVGTGLGLSLVKSILKMLRGTIDVRSTVNGGTTVTVTLPLEKATRTESTRGRRLPLLTGLATAQDTMDDTLKTLAMSGKLRRAEVFSGSGDADETLSSAKPVLNSIRTFLRQWCRLDSIAAFGTCAQTDLVIVDESEVESLLARLQGDSRQPSILILCSNTARHAHLNRHSSRTRVEFLSKPFGPHKLAKALLRCLTHRTSIPGDCQSQDQAATPAGQDDTRPPSTSLSDLVATTTPPTELPVEPMQAVRPALVTRCTILPSKQEILSAALDTAAATTAMSQAGDCVDPRPVGNEARQAGATTQGRSQRQPRCLLVDDNNINLRLLETYTKKRRYTDVTTATNGVEAVEAFESSLSRGARPDIVFMDLSMPIMGGLEATRRIREIEGTFDAEHAPDLARAADADGGSASSRTLVVALTGLASGKDQADAFSSGVDIYMTKPLSFKELGKLLDNWEARHC